jgi:ElaB/YqjD/DUF883 family membrane-anchored ribosome-binding protein
MPYWVKNCDSKRRKSAMKEERLAILSMVEKGIINVDEAERLLKAVNSFGDTDKKLSSVFSKASELAKNAAEKTEKFIDDSKPAVKKFADDAKPAVKKASDAVKEKAEALKKSYEEFKKDKKDDIDDEDFEQDVTIMPFSGDDEKKNEEENKEQEPKKEDDIEKDK